MCVDVRESVCNVLLKYGCYQHQLAEDKIVSAFVKPDMVVFDIGANIGWYSCLIHRSTQGRGRIVAVEPMPRALRLLRKSAESRPTVQVVPCAIGEASGYAHLCEAKALDVSQVRYSSGGEVEVVTIDDLAVRFGHPDVIKIDVEGAELMAFRGAVQTLSNTCPPFILFEYIPTNAAAFGGYTLMQLVEALRPGNYSILRLGHDAQLYSIDAPNEDGHLTNDYLAVPPGRLCEVRALDAAEVS
jgi:FkbM family methyltransferase